VLPRRDSRLHVRRSIVLLNWHAIFVIEFAFPTRHKHRGDAIAVMLVERTNLAHELFDRNTIAIPGTNAGLTTESVLRSVMKARAGNPACPSSHIATTRWSAAAERQIDTERLPMNSVASVM